MSQFPFDHQNEQRARQLLAAFVEGEPSVEAGAIELSLRTDPALVHEYVQQMTAHALLSWRHAQGDGVATADETLAAPPEPAIHHSYPLAGTPIQHIARFFSQSSLAATLLVAIVLYGTFGLAVWQMSRFQRRPAVVESIPHVVPNHDVVAKLVALHDCRWNEDVPLRVGDALTPETMHLLSGVAELELNAGTRLVVEGPADWSVDDRNRVLLRTGKLLAHVPKDAIGFTVETPIARIVDLGTEFSVEVGDSGTTDVQVLKGQVRILTESRSHNQNSESVITLSAGSGRRIEINAAGEPVVREIDNWPQRFGARPHGMHDLIYVYGALASSECISARRVVNRLIDGSGLKGDGHTNLPDETMWLSAFGKVKNEYVLFDLGRPYQLDSMKVWNYNESHGPHEIYRYLGVAQADIYVSSSGKGTPLDHPDEWRLVATDVKFDAADGTPNYSTPQFIDLGHVSARFVAMVIDDHLATDPRPGAEQCVGLSEVQFFGSRVEANVDQR
jgi:hypothetical protein